MYLCNINNCYQGADFSDSVQGVMILVRLSTEQRMNAERQLTVCSLPFHPLCLFKLSVDATELETMYTNCLKHLESN